MTRGFAVVDLETTGLFPTKHDRIVEVGVVLVSPDGVIESRHETLVNPERDMGPQHIHGITAAAAARAPRFEQVAPRIAELLDDRVPVAHNASFDARFLRHQMRKVGLEVAEPDRWLCTMRLSQSVSGFRRLTECCTAVGVKLHDAHSAAGDAYATAQLLNVYLHTVPDRQYWDAWLASAIRRGPYAVDQAVEWVARLEAFQQDLSFVEELIGSLTSERLGAQLNVDYLALLDRVLLDRVVSVSEAAALAELALGLDLTAGDVPLAHQAYFDGLVTAAWEDRVLSEDEVTEIQNVGHLLGIESAAVQNALVAPPATSAPSRSTGFHLNRGDIIVLTGEMQRPRDSWARELTDRGYAVKNNVVKKTRLVVAADPDSMSGKAKTARDYGITIVNEAGLENLLAASNP
ncbi:exonuclease domain-containing protein [Leifsonia xyli]|uniref:exonuclease domain-containing protein n=1 Tax=Leifsonia xyli TaxID=1575 RepID=UPI003D672616